VARGTFRGNFQEGRVTLHRDSFGFRKLEVYHKANEFFRSAYVLGKRLKRHDGFIRSQFLRAALSIKLNIAEGSEETLPKEKARLYRIARRSAGECSALLDDIEFTLNLPVLDLEPYYEELQIIIAMLVGLDRAMAARAAALKSRKRRKSE
jgi:four helix bundle protein